mgnify:CR=1 FL=1
MLAAASVADSGSLHNERIVVGAEIVGKARFSMRAQFRDRAAEIIRDLRQSRFNIWMLGCIVPVESKVGHVLIAVISHLQPATTPFIVVRWLVSGRPLRSSMSVATMVRYRLVAVNRQ